MGKKGGRKWYAVRVGHAPGVYTSWPECQAQVNGFSGAIFKSFPTPEAAAQFADAPAPARPLGPRRPTHKKKAPHRAANVHHFAAAHDSGGSSDGSAGSHSTAVELFFDGGSRGNPGLAGCGAALFPRGGGAPLDTAHAYLGTATSNEAEYQGLILGLSLALRHGATDVAICGDSKLVVNQLNGVWQIRNPRLARLLDVVKCDLLPSFGRWEVRHVYREANGVADALANEAMDSARYGALPRLPSQSAGGACTAC